MSQILPMPQRAAPVHATQAADLSAGPYRPSRILTEFARSREQERRQRAAAAERAGAQAEFRRIGRASTHAAIPAAGNLPAPAFGAVGGQPAQGAQARSFSAAASDRFTAGWATYGTGINADLQGALATLRARSRDWAVNTDTGERFFELVADNVVGSAPPRLQVRAPVGATGVRMDEAANQAIEDAWAWWCHAGRCDVTGQHSFTQLCRLAITAVARDGEFLFRRIRSPSLPSHGYALQMLDVDRIDTTHNVPQTAGGGNSIRMGVELDGLGRKVALHLLTAHPTDFAGSLAPATERQRVLAEDVLHDFIVKRPEQVRGYPWSAPILRRADTLAQYEQYALIAAKIGAAKMGFYVTDKEAPTGEGLTLEQYRDATGELVQDVEAGMLEALPPGVTVQTFDPDYPHANFPAFVNAAMRGLAVGLNVAHHNLSGDMSGVNYSSARIAELSERRHWRALQQWFITAFVRPVFLDWLKMALLTGSIQLPSGATLPADRWQKFADYSSFQPPGWAWVDPQADIDAAVTAMGADLRSLRQVSDEQGVDLEDVLTDNAALLAKYEASGLPPPAWLARQPAKPAAQPATQPKDPAA